MAENFNLNTVKEKINLITKYIKSQGDRDPFHVEMDLMEKYPDFYEKYPFLVKKLCKKDDVSMLYKMLENLEAIEKGDKSMASVEYSLGNELSEKYLKPVVNKLDKD
jgi:hypothetical protein